MSVRAQIRLTLLSQRFFGPADFLTEKVSTKDSRISTLLNLILSSAGQTWIKGSFLPISYVSKKISKMS